MRVGFLFLLLTVLSLVSILPADAEPAPVAAQTSTGRRPADPATEVGTTQAPPVTMLLSGGTFQLERTVIAGGGDSSAGASFSLAGTIGQAAADGNLTGGVFTLSSGFWSAASPSATPTKRRGQITSQ